MSYTDDDVRQALQEQGEVPRPNEFNCKEYSGVDDAAFQGALDSLDLADLEGGPVPAPAPAARPAAAPRRRGRGAPSDEVTLEPLRGESTLLDDPEDQVVAAPARVAPRRRVRRPQPPPSLFTRLWRRFAGLFGGG